MPEEIGDHLRRDPVLCSKIVRFLACVPAGRPQRSVSGVARAARSSSAGSSAAAFIEGYFGATSFLICFA